MPADLVVIKTERAECIADAVATLETVLEQAKAGHVTAVAIALVRSDGAINSFRSMTDDVGRLVGAMALAQSRLTREL